MFCPECGTRNEDDALFCCACGISLKEYADPPQPLQQQSFNQNRNQQSINQQQHHIQRKPERYKKPVSKAVIAVVLEGILAVGLIFGIYKVIGDKFSPESVAMTYWEATMNHDWGTAYDCCDFPESDLLTRQMYVNVNERNDEIIKYKSVHITDADHAKSQSGDWKFVLENMDGSERKSGDEDTKNYVIDYRTKGSSEKEYSYLTLTKTGKRQFLFWDEWRVTSSDSWCKDIQFQIPEGASITLNGVAVQGEEKPAEEFWKYITVPYLFVGEYQMEVTGEGFEPYRKVISVEDYGCDDAYVELRLSEETIQKVAEQAANDIKQILESALADKSFREVQDYFSQEALDEGYVEVAYENLTEIKSNGEDSGIVKLQLKNFVSTLDGYMSANYINLKVTVDREETYLERWNNSLKEDSEIIELYVNYVKEGDTWKLSNLPISNYDF